MLTIIMIMEIPSTSINLEQVLMKLILEVGQTSLSAPQVIQVVI